MKKIIFLIVAGILFSCNDDENSNLNTELIGSWKLIEVLSDPGDGSGTFHSVESKKIITFKSNGSVTSNGNLCEMSTSTDHPTSGTYSITKLTFNSSNCTNSNYNYTFKQIGNILIIYYPCFEACQAKYEKQ